jgi:ketosteroid isomerase-like protein
MGYREKIPEDSAGESIRTFYSKPVGDCHSDSSGDIAYDYGWHELALTPKDGGRAIRRRDRYVDIWRRNKEGNWKLWMYMDNQDIADPEPE